MLWSSSKQSILVHINESWNNDHNTRQIPLTNKICWLEFCNNFEDISAAKNCTFRSKSDLEWKANTV